MDVVPASLLRPSNHADPRRPGRVRAVLLNTNLGPALDLSDSGVRVEMTGRNAPLRADDRVSLVLDAPEARVPVPARVAWIRSTARGRTFVGLQFLDSSDAFKARVRGIACACMDMRLIDAGDGFLGGRGK
jgi:hypothetical protein